jgi:hypothetical protein
MSVIVNDLNSVTITDEDLRLIFSVILNMRPSDVKEMGLKPEVYYEIARRFFIIADTNHETMKWDEPYLRFEGINEVVPEGVTVN